MNFKKTPLEGVVLIEPRVFSDARGAFFEEYRADLFLQNGITDRFVQDNHSVSAKNVLRGLHYQLEPKAQSKLVQVVKGKAFDVVVDIRRGSKTFGHSFSFTLSAENRILLFIPKGFAHGFLSLEDGTELVYKVSEYYSPEHERGVRWDDPALKIAWPFAGQPLLSDKDKKNPLLSDAPF